MIILHGDNNDKEIKYILNNDIIECNDNTYIVQMPILVCNKKDNAEYIQSKINTFVNELSRTILLNNMEEE